MGTSRAAYAYSVVIPLYKSERTIGEVVGEVTAEFARLEIERYEIILVNDGSPDGVLAAALSLYRDDPHITVIDLANNSGQGNAVFAGLKQASGDYIITMDDDLQHPGYEIGTLIDAILERDDDVVFAAFDESGNKRSFVRRAGTRFHWWIAERFAGKPKGVQSNSFRIMKRFIRDEYVHVNGHHIGSYGLMYRCTSHISNVVVSHRPRKVGKSGFTLYRLLNGVITAALSYSELPLRLAAAVGLLLFAISCVGMVVAVIIHRFYIGLFWGFALLCSFQLIALGVLGEYVNRIFTATTNIPRYAVRNIYVHDDAPIGGSGHGESVGVHMVNGRPTF